MTFRKMGIAVLAAAIWLTIAAVARADTITFEDQGTWTLENLGLADTDLDTADSADDTYTILLTYNSLGYTGGATDYIEGVMVKVSANVDAGEGGGTTAPGTWTFNLNELSNIGCEGGESGVGCYIDGSSAVTGGPGDEITYTWTFLLDIDGELFTDPLQASIKALFRNGDGSNAGLLSENITLQPGGEDVEPSPEPASMALFGLALMGAAYRRRWSSR
jgi:hypothetical protein